MSQENVEVVKRLYEAWQHGDFAAEIEAFDPEVEVVFDYGLDRVSTKGLDGMRDSFRDYLSLWQIWTTGPIEKVVEHGDHVVVSHRIRGRSKRGAPVHIDDAGVAFTFRDGKIVWLMPTDQVSKALEAVGLRE